jgi:hypothetical protein
MEDCSHYSNSGHCCFPYKAYKAPNPTPAEPIAPINVCNMSPRGLHKNYFYFNDMKITEHTKTGLCENKDDDWTASDAPQSTVDWRLHGGLGWRFCGVAHQKVGVSVKKGA